MKILFYLGILGLLLYEFLKVYFIMPMPGSQQWNSLDFAYFLHQYRWWFRAFWVMMSLLGIASAFSGVRKWIPAFSLILVLGLVAMLNFKMSADAMFKEPNQLIFLGKEEFKGSDSTLVVVVGNKVQAKAYPVRYLVYHHQIRDTISGNPVMVTYCSVCRTGRVYSPNVQGSTATFRLVGMDYFNAMFEDSQTGSWWQQATGEAIVGPLKGQKLEEIEMMQMSAFAFFSAYPEGKIMDADPDFLSKYDISGKYESGKSTGKLTGTDPFSWNEKSWVVGIAIGEHSKAFDWNELQSQKILLDKVGDQSIVLLLASDSQSFVAFKRPRAETFIWKNDTLISGTGRIYSFTGRSLDNSGEDLERVPAYQEFWHSWRTFHPETESARE